MSTLSYKTFLISVTVCHLTQDNYGKLVVRFVFKSMQCHQLSNYITSNTYLMVERHIRNQSLVYLTILTRLSFEWPENELNLDFSMFGLQVIYKILSCNWE